MSFVFLEYYLLSKKSVFSTNMGDVTGPYLLSELTALDIEFVERQDTIVFERTDSAAKRSDLVIGMPDILEISRNKFQRFMRNYDIPALLSIKPYVKLAGNDVTAQEDCQTVIATEYKYIDINKEALVRSQIYARLADGRLKHNHNC